MASYKTLFWVVLWLLISGQSVAQPQVLASIKPLQLIAQAVLGDGNCCEALLPVGATPHHFTMRPSDMRRLSQADLIIWLGEASENYLAKPIANLESDIVVVDLQELLDVRVDGYLDPHLWLSGQKAVQVAQEIVKKLILMDPESAPDYQANLAGFIKAVEIQEGKIRNEVVQRRHNYIVYHDAYSYFEDEYGVSHRAVVAINPEGNPGAKHLIWLDRLIATERISCMLVEPESNLRIVKLMSKESEMRVQMIDPMAGDVPVGPEAYLQFLQGVTQKIMGCI